MQLVEHHAAERAEQIGRVGARQQQRELLGRGEQNVGRVAALPLPLGGGRVAGAGFQPHRQAHLPDRDFQVAGDVDGQRLERGDVEGVQALRLRAAPRPGETSFAPDARGVRSSSTSVGRKPGQRLAAAGGRDQQHRAPGPGLGQQFELVRARRPAAGWRTSARKPAAAAGFRERARRRVPFSDFMAYLTGARGHVLGSQT